MVSGPIRFASLLSAAFVIVAVAPPAARAADLYCEPIQIKCGGFEPNWSFELTTDNALKFTDPENPNWETKPVTVDACARRAGNGYTIEAGSLLDVSAQVKRERCVEPNDQVRDYSLSIRFNQGAETSSRRAVSGTGCCWR